MTFALIYHDVVPRERRDTVGFPGPLAARYKLDPRRFRDHLDRIAATGVRVGTVDAGGVLPAAALTFDDGGASALAAAAELERRGWRGHFFVTTARIGTPGFLDADGVVELARRGHLVGSHSHTHPAAMARLAPAGALDEWRRSADVLGELLGAAPQAAAAPGGSVSPAVIDACARAGYRLLMTSRPSPRLRRHGALAVLGRFTVWASTPASQAAGYARGAPLACGRLWVEWHAKSLPRSLAPRMYERGRRLRAGRG